MLDFNGTNNVVLCLCVFFFSDSSLFALMLANVIPIGWIQPTLIACIKYMNMMKMVQCVYLTPFIVYPFSMR